MWDIIFPRVPYSAPQGMVLTTISKVWNVGNLPPMFDWLMNCCELHFLKAAFKQIWFIPLTNLSLWDEVNHVTPLNEWMNKWSSLSKDGCPMGKCETSLRLTMWFIAMVFKPTIKCVWPCYIIKHSTNLVANLEARHLTFCEYYPSYISSSSD